MKAKDVPTAAPLRFCTLKTKLYHNTKPMKEPDYGVVSLEKFKHEIYIDIKKFKIKPLKNCMASILILIFGLSQKMEAQTGKIDPTFNSGGTGANAAVITTPIQTDGKIILGGEFTSYNGLSRNRIIRVAANGTLDATFSIGTGFDSTVNEVVIQPDGKLIAVGIFNKYSGTNRKGIVRINTNGTLDASFNPGNGANNVVCGASLQSDGKIIVCGAFNKINNITRNRIARLNTNGTLDATFNPPTAANNRINTIAIQSDGKIIAGGAFTIFNGSPNSRVVRLSSTGVIDASFITGLGFVGTSTNTAVRVSKIQSDGKIIVGGLFESYNGFNLNNIVRLNSDGTRDLTFIPGTGANNGVNSISIQTDGKIIIAGDFTSFNGTPVNRIARLNTDGTIDNTFTPDAGANNPIFSTTLQPDNTKLIIGGKFTSYDGVSTGTNTRLLMACSSVTASIANQEKTSCYGLSNGSATITASGGFGLTYSWSPVGGTNAIANGLSSGSYTCVVTNDCGNSATVPVIIFDPQPFSVAAGASSTISSCGTASLSSIGTGGTEIYNFNWMPGNITIQSPSVMVTVSPSVTTTYTLFATDAKGCTDTKTQMVTVNRICPVSVVPCGLSYSNLNSYSTCQPVINAINYRFSFYDNVTNALVAVKTQTSHIIYFNTVSSLNYGKTYKWTVSVDDGFGFGPESNNTCTITFDAPKTTVSCGNSYTNLNSYSVCQPIYNATNYRFSFYDNTTNALLAVKTQTSYIIYFNTVAGLAYNKIYKWTVEVEYNDPNSGTLMFGPPSTNSCTITFNEPQTATRCGNYYTNLNSYSVCQPIYNATNYRFSFYDNITNALLAVKTQTTHIIYFNTVSGLNYDKTYKVTVAVEYTDPNTGEPVFGPESNNSCPITFNEPQTSTPCGNSYTNLNSYSVCQPIYNATNYRFSFYDNITNALLAVKTQTSYIIYFNTVTGLNYGKTYKWTVEVEYNNPNTGTPVFGPASSSSCTITFNAPQTTVPCGITITDINSYAVCQPINQATNYRFRFYDNNGGGLIGERTQTSHIIYFNTVAGLVFNTTYKWTVEVEYYDPNTEKLMFGPASSSLCTVNYGTGAPIVIDETNTNNATARVTKQSFNNDDPQFLINLFPNPTKDKITVESSEAINNIKVYNISGELVLSLKTTNEVDLTNFNTGLYIVVIETVNNVKHFEIIKE